MVYEIGAGIGGAIAGISFSTILFHLLNAKVDKKQDTKMCNTISKNIKEDLDKGEEKFDKIMEKLGAIEISNGKIKQELKHLNDKT